MTYARAGVAINHGANVTCHVCSYYSFGGQTMMRDANGLQYFLTDHLGSTVAVTNASGTLTSQQRYLPFGQARTDIGTITQTDFGYTGQRQLDEGMGGLMDYKFRMYSPILGRFISPDTITPGGPQGLNRYAYVSNNPVNFNDPTGHRPVCDEPSECKRAPKSSSLLMFKEDVGQAFTDKEKKILETGAYDVAKALARGINSQCNLADRKMGECSFVTPQEAFYDVFGGPILVKRVAGKCTCSAMHQKQGVGDQYVIWVYSSTSTQWLMDHPRLMVHEIGHAFQHAIDLANMPLPISAMSAAGVNNRNGFAGPVYIWQLSVDMAEGEIYSDMFVGWVYGRWEVDRFTGRLTENAQLKSQFMTRTVWDIYGILGR